MSEGLWKQIHREYVVEYNPGSIESYRLVILDLSVNPISRRKAQLWGRVVALIIENSLTEDYEAIDRLLESDQEAELTLAETLIEQTEQRCQKQ
jgi:hypothetical protein